MKPSVPATALTALVATLGPTLALAHGGTDAGAHHGLAAGFLHPLTGIDHLAAMLAVGAWSAVAAPQRGWRSALHAPVAFVALLFAGALLARAGFAVPLVEPMVAASLVALGLLLAAQWHLGLAAGAAVAGGFALFHGLAHGHELAGGAALAGMLLATALLHAAGLALGHAARTRSHWWPRAAGTASLLLGAMLLVR